MSTNPLHGARVQRRISLDEIASATRLSPRIVSALDRGCFEALPAGIYARAYVRTFATAVGLDGDATLESLGERLPRPVELSATLLDRLQPRPTDGSSAEILRDVLMDAALLTGITILLVALVARFCGLPVNALIRLVPGPMIGLCAPVWIVYEMLLGRLCGQRIFWSGNSFLIPASTGIRSFPGVSPVACIRRFSSSFSSARFAAAAGSLIRFARSPGSFFRS